MEEGHEIYSRLPTQRCSADFCPYFGTCEHEGTIVDTLSMDRQVHLRKEEYVSIDEAERCLRENLQDAFRSADKGLHLIKAQTGLGKTGEYVRMAAEHPEDKLLIALPTNNLKEEVKDRLVEKGIPEREIFMTASVHGNAFIPPEIHAQISRMHNRGIHNMTRRSSGFIMKKSEQIPLSGKLWKRNAKGY